ncbi:MAG TPA: ribosome biogenesis GTPase Der [Deltaproteobacteria bacterium]|nr:ribosome biogenesis GTPase Der [Deltaproteobacteria bacterium]HPI94522.1 ribosome biogenesis GTPase Der [Deltaproteobacteria bacterium]HPR55179.1 ribosome biogenesis GTPase Der [Deltaproteobacteria bacterium]
MPVVAIVGRPNAGKSTLFNLLVGERRAIVGPQRGITRDRIYGRWALGDDIEVDLVDTGGFDTIGDIEFSGSVREQTMLAIADADLIICLFDGREAPTPDDQELVNILRRSRAQVIHAANKVDDPMLSHVSDTFFELGIDQPLEISALNRRGIAELREAVRQKLGTLAVSSLEDTGAVRVSILGRPNVGKSMLLNRIIGHDRAIVSPEAGTTRDYVDISVTHRDREYVFVDTAGIRRKARIDDTIERASVMRSLKNIGKSHVCLLLIDPHEGLTDQDKKLCSIVIDHGRAFVVVVNKCDLIDNREARVVREDIRHSLRFMPDAPVVFTSALTGENVERLYPTIETLYAKTTTRVSTGRLNRLLSDITTNHTPPLVKNKPLKLYYITQTGTVPPRFQVVVNHPESIPAAYSRFLTHSVKKTCELEGIPIVLHFAGRKQH